MTDAWTRKYSEFTPAQAAHITGVSATLQRDWRRRGLLPKKDDARRTKFTLEDLIVMAAMRNLSDAGVIIKYTDDISRHTVKIAIAYIESWIIEEGFADKVFRGDTASASFDSWKYGVEAAVRHHPRFIAHFTDDMSRNRDGTPCGRPVEDGHKTWLFHSLDRLEAASDDIMSPCIVVMDIRRLADELFLRSGNLPLFTIHPAADDGECQE